MSEKQLVFVDMDDVLCDFSGAHRRMRDLKPDVAYPQSIAGFFETLAPISDAVNSVNELRKYYRVFVLSAPSTRNPLSYTEKRLWIESQFGYEFTKKLILSPDKSLLKGDFLIDDRSSGNGQESFAGELIHFGSQQFSDWQKVLAHLLG